MNSIKLILILFFCSMLIFAQTNSKSKSKQKTEQTEVLVPPPIEVLYKYISFRP